MSVDPAVNTAAGAPLAHIFAGRRDGERSVQSREPVRGNSPAVGEGAVGGVAYGEHSFWSAKASIQGGLRVDDVRDDVPTVYSTYVTNIQ